MDLRAEIQAWIADDPDPADRAELVALLDGWPGSEAELAERFAGPLTFGTAGLRGPERAGPNGMNRAVVRGATAGLVRWLAAQGASGPLVVGYDGRRGSRAFAEEVVRVATGAGRAAQLMPRPLPTPVLAFAVRHLGAAAGVMVTASHNPARDNGYKVYLGQIGGPLGAGAQIAPPSDVEIEASIRAVGALAAVPLGPAGAVVDESVVSAYVEAAAARVEPDSARDIAIAYTPLHGVGAATLRQVFDRAGFAAPAVVAEQAEPDPAFPTVAFPNPEEAGAMDLVTALATRTGADLVVANDPDADRCAVAVPVAGGGWRSLHGDEVGILLADHLMRRGVSGLYSTTVVSSSLLGVVCAARGQPYAQTLTGFKWIVRGGEGLVYGYEEALGYCVAPDLVRDKDGITAAVLVAELAAELKARGQSLADRLDELAAEFGVYRTDQISVRLDSVTKIDAVMARLRAHPPAQLLGEPATVTDLRPDADVVIVGTPSARLVARPSGTEPKLKAYLEVRTPVTGGEVALARGESSARLESLRAETRRVLGLAS